MLIQKVFHVHRSLDETQARLSNMDHGGESSNGFRKFEAASHGERGLMDSFSLMGFRRDLNLELLPTDDKSQVLFHSVSGAMEVCGLLELHSIRDHLTEVQLTLDYQIQSPIRRTFDRLFGAVNSRVDRQILSMQRWMEGRQETVSPTREERKNPGLLGAMPQPAM